jgi:hypothetical protein
MRGFVHVVHVVHDRSTPIGATPAWLPLRLEKGDAVVRSERRLSLYP